MGSYKISPRLYAALYLKKKSATEVVGFANEVVSAMTNNPRFQNPIPTLSDVQTAITAAQNANNAAATGGDAQKEDALTKRYQLETLLVDLGFYVSGIANQDPLTAKQTIESAAMSARKTPEKAPVPDAVSTLVAVYMNNPTILTKWKGVKYARAYELYFTATPNDASSWIFAGTTTKKRFLVADGLQSGQRYYFKVNAIGVSGKSGDSNIASCMAG